jgi:hypothetical protein
VSATVGKDEPVATAFERGVAFTYYGPRRGLFRRRGIAAAVVVAVDQAIGVVHVRTLRQKGEVAVTDIGHIPILWSALDRCLHEMNEKAPRIADDAVRDVALWRQRHARGEVGAFSCPLWEAEHKAWEAVPVSEKELGRDALYIAYAYPTKDDRGGYGTVEVGVHRHREG